MRLNFTEFSKIMLYIITKHTTCSTAEIKLPKLQELLSETSKRRFKKKITKKY